MDNPKPLKRHIDMQPISRNHHFGLLFCWKIRTGLAKEVSLERMEKYKDWFFQRFLIPHFEIEEKYLFPILGSKHPHIIQAIAEHHELQLLFLSKKTSKGILHQIDVLLTNHIRFEERVLFNEIQEKATNEQLKMIVEKHPETIVEDNWNDEFWIRKNQ